MSLSGYGGNGTIFKMQDYSFWLTSPRNITSYKFPCIQYPFFPSQIEIQWRIIFSNHRAYLRHALLFPWQNIYRRDWNFSTTNSLFQLPSWDSNLNEIPLLWFQFLHKCKHVIKNINWLLPLLMVSHVRCGFSRALKWWI